MTDHTDVLPPWLDQILSTADIEAPEGDWPNYGRTQTPIDWPRLIEDHPEALVPDHDMLTANDGASWDSIVTAYRLLEQHGCTPSLEVYLGIQDDGRMSVEPMALYAQTDIAAITSEVDAVLIAGGRPAAALRGDDHGDLRTWLLDA